MGRHRRQHEAYRRSMKATQRIFIVPGWPMVIGGLVMMAVSAMDTDNIGLLLGLGGGGLSLLSTGIVFLFVAR